MQCIAPGRSALGRWLLHMRNRIGSERLPLAQEILAQMIGVQRNVRVASRQCAAQGRYLFATAKAIAMTPM